MMKSMNGTAKVGCGVVATVILAAGSIGWGVLRHDTAKNAETSQAIERRVDETEATLKVVTFQLATQTQRMERMDDKLGVIDEKVDKLLERKGP